MAKLTVNLLGKFSARLNEAVLSGLDARKAQELFCYLLLYRDRPHCREPLAGLVWTSQVNGRTKKYLRQVLWQLQSALAPCQGPHGILLIDPEWIRVNPHADIQLDVATLEQTYTAFHGRPGAHLGPGDAGLLQEAAQLYRGDLLEGCYEDWCLYERERCQNMYLVILDKLTDYCEAQCEYDAGLVYGQLLLRYDVARERTHRRLMRLYYLAGDRTEALRQYERCVTALQSELSVTPSEQTIQLYEAIRAERLISLATLPLAESRLSDDAAFPALLHHLRLLEATLRKAERQLQQDIQAIEQAVRDGHGLPGGLVPAGFPHPDD